MLRPHGRFSDWSSIARTYVRAPQGNSTEIPSKKNPGVAERRFFNKWTFRKNFCSSDHDGVALEGFNFVQVARQTSRRHWGALGRSEGLFHDLIFQYDFLSRDQVHPPGGCGKAEIYSSDTERWKSGTTTILTNCTTPHLVSVAKLQGCAFHDIFWQRATLSPLNPSKHCSVTEI